eukprot:s182_g19.t1
MLQWDVPIEPDTPFPASALDDRNSPGHGEEDDEATPHPNARTIPSHAAGRRGTAIADDTHRSATKHTSTVDDLLPGRRLRFRGRWDYAERGQQRQRGGWQWHGRWEDPVFSSQDQKTLLRLISCDSFEETWEQILQARPIQSQPMPADSANTTFALDRGRESE